MALVWSTWMIRPQTVTKNVSHKVTPVPTRDPEIYEIKKSRTAMKNEVL